jgi:imidazolonepropionase
VSAVASGKQKVDLLIRNIAELVTLDPVRCGAPPGPRRGAAMGRLGVIENAALAVRDGRVLLAGPDAEVAAQVGAVRRGKALSGAGKTVVPGFVDAHTHLLFAGSRERELQLKAEGLSYMEILARGHGIQSTVNATRKASEAELMSQALRRLDAMLLAGTTTAEVKSGYGLSADHEERLLRSVPKLEKASGMTLVATFLGAHAVPVEHAGAPDRYVAGIVDKMLPLVAAQRLARFCDVFCEEGVFDLAQTARILEAAKRSGLGLKVHADEFKRLGSAKLAASMGATSCDHLLHSSAEDFEAMSASGTVAVLCPTTALVLGGGFADARGMIAKDVAVALGSDLSPNCWCESMQVAVSLAVHRMRMSPAEALVAATVNSAQAIGEPERGVLAPGAPADLAMLDVPSHALLGYRIGTNLVHTVVKGGEVLVERGRMVPKEAG